MMLSFYICIVAATCILAQNSSAPSAPPECAQNCTTKYLNDGAGGFCSGDDACFCQDAAFWADITCCFQPYCTAAEETETYSYLVNYCRHIGSRSVPEIARRNPVGCPEISSSIYAAATPTATSSLQASATGEPPLDIGGLSTLAETAIAVGVLIIAALVLVMFYQLRKRYLKRAMADASKMPRPHPIAPAPPPVSFGNDIELPPYSRTDEGWGKDKSDANSTMGEPVKPFETV